jgi:transcriptional regulator with XRE-family HTH domain
MASSDLAPAESAMPPITLDAHRDSTVSARHRLVAARRSRGWSQEKLALLLRRRGLGTTRKAVVRWERGVVPDSAAQRHLADLFGVTAGARAALAWPDWLPSGDVAGVSETWDYAGTVAALSDVTGCAFVDRRDFLALVGPELLLPIYMWRLNPGPWLAYRAHGQQVTAALVAEVERLAAIRRRMDDEHGGGALLGMLDSDFRFVTGMLKHGRYTEPVGRSLSAAAAELARLAGFAAFDSGRQAAAQQYYLAGLRAANASGDHALAVNIVGLLGVQAYSAGRLADSVALMEAATAESRATPSIVQAMPRRATLYRPGMRWIRHRRFSARRSAATHRPGPTGSIRHGSRPRSAGHCSTSATTSPPSES